MDTEYRHVLRRQHVEQLCIRIQHISPSPYHPQERREHHDDGGGICLGEEIYQNPRLVLAETQPPTRSLMFAQSLAS